jgi:hypothetical protein
MPGADFSDLSPFFNASEFATAATWTAVATGAPIAGLVLLDAPGDLVLDDVATIDYGVTFRASEWPAMRERDAVSVGAWLYRVRAVTPIDDGLLVRAALTRIGPVVPAAPDGAIVDESGNYVVDDAANYITVV